MPKIKLELGDIFELTTSKGFAYLQCVEIPLDIRNDVELIKVFYTLHPKRILDLTEIAIGNYFFNRFPLKAAKNRKIVSPIGNIALPENFTIPLCYRTENVAGDVWQIVDAKTLRRENINELTEDQKKLSPWGGMNDTLIIELLEKGWNLENWKLGNMFNE
jgi:hypothetical protein